MDNTFKLNYEELKDKPMSFMHVTSTMGGLVNYKTLAEDEAVATQWTGRHFYIRK